MNMNPVGWFEIYVQDMPRATAFYESMLAIRLQELEMPGIEMMAFPMDEQTTGAPGALIRVPGVPSGPGGTMVYFSCADCATEAGRAVANGGTMEQEKMAIGDYGFVSIVHDPDGNRIGLHSRA